MASLPLAPTRTTATLERSSPAAADTIVWLGRVVPSGHSAVHVAAVGPIRATRTTTAPTPVVGTPPTPSTGKVVVLSAARVPVVVPVPERVSSTTAFVLSGT